MFVLRQHEPDGAVVAEADTRFGIYRDSDGARFANIDQDGTVEFGDHYRGRLDSGVVFSTGVDGNEKPVFFLDEVPDPA